MLRQGDLDREHGRVSSSFVLVGGYIKNSEKGSMINFQDFRDFNLQGSTQACSVFTPLF